jgi:NAD(P)H-hydrate epimerase
MSELILTREQVREVDRRAIEVLGIPGLILMENAAINAATLIRDHLVRKQAEPKANKRISVLCGGGNNGGDGYAIARHLHNRGYGVQLFAAKAPSQLKGDAAANHAICRNMGLPIATVDGESAIDEAATMWQGSDIVVDALLGTGFTGQVRQPLASLIDRINSISAPTVIAIDTPSGLDCQTGAPAASTVRAHLTISLVAQKVGFTVPGAEAFTGQVQVADIGVPPELIRDVAAG